VIDDSMTKHRGHWSDPDFFFEEVQDHWCARFLFKPTLPEIDETGTLDVLIGGNPRAYDVELQRRAAEVISSFPEIAARIVSYLCTQTRLEIEGNVIDLTEVPQIAQSTSWRISWLECTSTATPGANVVCHLQDEAWAYICWKVSLTDGQPTGLVGNYW
jgi:hypothetical protein